MSSREQILDALDNAHQHSTPWTQDVILDAARAFLPYAPTQCDTCEGTGETGHQGTSECLGDPLRPHDCLECGGLGILPWQPDDTMIERTLTVLDNYAIDMGLSHVKALLVAAFREDTP